MLPRGVGIERLARDDEGHAVAGERRNGFSLLAICGAMPYEVPRDNGIVYIPRGIAQQGQLAAAITEIGQLLGPDVVRLRYTIGESWSGEPAIFFRVLLSDEASEHRLHQVTSRVQAIIEEHLDPLNSWGLMSYYNFRSQTEQEILREPVWA